MKNYSLLATVSVLLLLAAGCSGKKSDTKGVVVWIPGDEGEYAYYFDMFENFRSYQEERGESFLYTIEQQPWSEYWTKLPLEVNSGRGPDLFLTHIAYSDVLIPISRELEFSPQLLDQFLVTDTFTGPSGKPLFIPTLFVSKIMYGNKSLWSDYENYPRSWEELEATALKLNRPDRGVVGFDYSYHLLWDLGYQNGETMTNEKREALFSREVLKTISRWEEEGVTNFLEYGKGDSENSFYEGSAAIIYGEPWMEFWAPHNIDSYAFPVPGGQTHSYAELSFGISKNVSDNLFPLLNEFVKFMLTDRETITAIVKGNSGIPNNREITVEYEPGTAGSAVLKTYQEGHTFFSVSPASLERVYRSMLGNFMVTGDVERVIREAEIAAEDIDLNRLYLLEEVYRQEMQQ